MADTLLAYSYSLITFSLLYFFLKKTLDRKGDISFKKEILWWVLFGFVFNLYGFSWLYTTYPLIWMKGGMIQIIGIGILHLILSLASALCFFVVGYGFVYSKKIHIHLKPFIFGLSLTLAEVLRSLFISLLYLGNKTTIDLHFNAGTIGNALALTPLIEYAYFGGTFILTCIVGYLVYCAASYENVRRYIWHTFGIFGLAIVIHFFVPTYGPQIPITVSVITTDFTTLPDNEILAAFKEQNKRIHTMTTSLKDSNPSIIVYPEDTRYFAYIGEDTKNTLRKDFQNTLFIDGDTTRGKEGLSNVSLFYSTKEDKLLGRGKSFLLPFNEYIPYFFKPIFYFFVPQAEMDTYIRNHTYTPIHSVKTIPFGDIRIGTLLCSEILSYKVLSDVKDERPDVVFFQSHLNVFHNNLWFRMHMLSFSTIAAAQLRRPLIASVNGAPSHMISPYGRVVRTMPAGFSTSTYIIVNDTITPK